jgi:DNA polymerase III subunit chi
MASACSTGSSATFWRREPKAPDAVRVDFYHLTRDPAEAVIPRLAEQTLKAGERLLVVSADAAQLERIGKALWDHAPESFLANGRAGGGHDDRQPILLADTPEPANRAAFCILADGAWRAEALRFARVFYLFDEPAIAAARACWRSLKDSGCERHYWQQQGRKWVEGP